MTFTPLSLAASAIDRVIVIVSGGHVFVMNTVLRGALR